jgi:hypothetical protein
MNDKTIFRTNYQSDITNFLQQLPEDGTSPAVDAEKEKYQRINELRDNPDSKAPKSKLWEGF